MLIKGRNPVREALKSGRQVHRLLIAHGSRGKPVDEIKKTALKSGIKIEEVPGSEIEKLSPEGGHQGVLAWVDDYKTHNLADFIQSDQEKAGVGLLVALDQIQDPQNLGSIIRSAAFMGAGGVIIPRHHAAGITTAVVKAAVGALEWIPIIEVVNLVQALTAFQESGYWVVGGEPIRGEHPDRVDLTYPTIVVIGGEGKGLRRLVREKCDHIVRIPGVGKTGSLNAAVAAAILLYEAVRQRLHKEDYLD